MSAGSFDSSNHDSDKRRIAHKGASSSAKLFLSLTNKRESIGKVCKFYIIKFKKFLNYIIKN